jgi:hypothetical protein
MACSQEHGVCVLNQTDSLLLATNKWTACCLPRMDGANTRMEPTHIGGESCTRPFHLVQHTRLMLALIVDHKHILLSDAKAKRETMDQALVSVLKDLSIKDDDIELLHRTFGITNEQQFIEKCSSLSIVCSYPVLRSAVDFINETVISHQLLHCIGSLGWQLPLLLTNGRVFLYSICTQSVFCFQHESF